MAPISRHSAWTPVLDSSPSVRQQAKVQFLGFLPCTCVIWIEFQAPGLVCFSSGHRTHLRYEPASGKYFYSLVLSLCFLNKLDFKRLIDIFPWIFEEPWYVCQKAHQPLLNKMMLSEADVSYTPPWNSETACLCAWRYCISSKYA